MRRVEIDNGSRSATSSSGLFRDSILLFLNCFFLMIRFVLFDCRGEGEEECE